MQHSIDGPTIRLERTFEASQQKVWDAFTVAEQFVRWWGPKGWNTEVKEFNFVDGGRNHYGMRCDDPAQGEWYGKYSWGIMEYSNIRPIDGYEYTDYFADENAVVQQDMPTSATVMEFVDLGSSTKVISVTTFDSEESVKTVVDMGMIRGITETWNRLDEQVRGS